MRIATFNVNSVKARLPNLLDWLGSAAMDVVLLQETKTVDADFPRLELESAGWTVEIHGQKSYNGVAILSRHPIRDVTRGLPGAPEDEQARYIEATIGDLRIASIYLPNGNPVSDPAKYGFKLSWMARLRDHVQGTLLPSEQPFVLGGDYNICPTDADVYDPEKWADDALCRPESRAAFRRLLHLGLTEAWSAMHPGREHVYSYWDYVQGRWQKDEGLRIDHFLLSPAAADRMRACEIDKAPRGKDKASDHTPVWVDIADQRAA
jgi:exodeoxyribonuclease-3